MNSAKINAPLRSSRSRATGFLRIALAPDWIAEGTSRRQLHFSRRRLFGQRFEKELSLYCRFKLFLEGVSRMPHSRRPWSEDELAKLGSYPPRRSP